MGDATVFLLLNVTGLPRPDHPAAVLQLHSACGKAGSGQDIPCGGAVRTTTTASQQYAGKYRAGQAGNTLYLPQCRQLEAYLPADSRLAGKTRIGVHCLQPIEWSIMVPVTISTNASVVVLVRPVRSGQEISADDLGMRQLGTGETAPAATLISADQAIGKVAVTTLGKGLALRSDMLRAPYIVQQNQTVTLVAEGNGFRVSNTGRALGNASKGQPVQVRSSAGQIVRGIAESPGVVAVER